MNFLTQLAQLAPPHAPQYSICRLGALSVGDMAWILGGTVRDCFPPINIDVKMNRKQIQNQGQKQIYKMSSGGSSRIYHEYEQEIPKKEEWALINQHKAMEFQRMKQLQKQSEWEKKIKLKKELDNQLNSKTDANAQQREADKRYYQYISKKAEQMKQKEDKQKIQKHFRRKYIEEQNQYYLDKMRNSKHQSTDPGYHLDIGLKSEMQRKRKEESIKREMLDTLDKQIQIKAEQKKNQKMQDLHIDNLNMQYQYEQFDKRNRPHKYYGQNPNVYNYYKRLEEEKSMKEKELQYLMVEEAAHRQRQEENKKLMMKEQQKYHLNSQMKETLDHQIKLHNQKGEEQKRTNPEDISYAVIGNVFKQKYSPYDKKQYSQYLRRQAEEQNSKKKRQKYMSEEEYRMNMNQLNRAVSGDYAFNKYIDRSIGSIGEGKNVNVSTMHEAVKDEDKNVVQKKLQNIRHKTRHIEYNDRSF